MCRNRYSCRVLMKHFLQKRHISNFIAIRSVGAEMFHAEGWMDGWTKGWAERQRDRYTDTWTSMTKLVVAFRNFANLPKMVWH
jgi:hypothetical protein